MAKIVELIYSNNELRGKGINGNPYRRIEQWFTKDGDLVFEKDPCLEDLEKEKCDNCDPKANCSGCLRFSKYCDKCQNG